MNHEHDQTWVHHVREALASGDLVDPPVWVRERARRLFHSHGPKLTASLVDRVRATLIFDSRRMSAAPAGIRSIGVIDGPWQLLYRGGDVDVDLLVRPNQDGHTLSVRGQALPLGTVVIGEGVVEALPSNTPERLHGRPIATVRSEVEPSGEFALSNLERGRYDVLLRFGAREIELSDVEL